MQVKIIALAIAGLMSGGAFAQTTVQIGGKVDAGYNFTRAQRADANPSAALGCGSGAPRAPQVCTGTGAPAGGTTTEQLTDGGASTSRLTFVAKEDLGSGYGLEVNMDLRFGGGYHATKGGITTNDKKVLILRTPYLNALWGVSNLGGQIYFGVTEKPYMISPKDLEIVKYGISQIRESTLTSRNTTLYTNPINFGPVGLLFHTTYAFGDNRVSGASNVNETLANGTGATVPTSRGPQGSGDVQAAGFEWKVGNTVSGGFDVNARRSTTNFPTPLEVTTAATATDPISTTTFPGKNGMQFTHTFVNIKPIKGVKVAASFNTYKGYDGNGGSFDEKNTNFVLAYNMNDKLEVGVAVSRLRDLAESKNSGSGWMIGGAYFLSKSAYVYAAHSRQDFERNQTSLPGKYDGTVAGFSTTISKVDSHTTKVGIVKEF